jgi:hypothetical protein
MPPIIPPIKEEAMPTSAEDYRSVYRVAAAATLIMLVIIPLQIVVFALHPIPTGVEAWFTLMAEKPLVGLFHADFFIMVNNALIACIYLAFYHSLKGVNKGLMQLAIALGFIGIAAYLSSNKTFELFALSKEFFVAGGEAERLVLLGAGKAALSGWQGTAFDAYYVLNGITLLTVSALMLKGGPYGKATALIGLASGFFMTVPSTAGTLGLVFSLLSLIPWYVFSIRCVPVFIRLQRG